MKAWYKNLKDKVTHLFKVTRTVWSLYTALICVAARGFDMVLAKYQSAIFNPWKVRWNWIPFYQNSFVISPGLLYHLIRRDGGRLSNEAFTSNPIVSSKQWFNGLKITNWMLHTSAETKNLVCQQLRKHGSFFYRRNYHCYYYHFCTRRKFPDDSLSIAENHALN